MQTVFQEFLSAPALAGGIAFEKPLPQTLLNIADKTRASTFAWRGQFSPQLVESLLRAYCPENAHILDPFSGSGTSLLEAACLNLRATASEINPAAWLLTRVYTLCTVGLEERQAALSAVEKLSHSLWATEEPEKNLWAFAGKRGAIGIIAGAQVILMDLFIKKLTRDHYEKIFRKLSQAIRCLPVSTTGLTVMRSDARALPLENEEVDFVLTSPPYINVFNYHQHYRRSAELLGYDLLTTARSEIGSNRANRGNRFLTVIQYCLDMAVALMELRRVCRDNARLIFVVGHESNVLGVPFPNADIISRLALETGAFVVVQRQSRWYTNKFGSRIREDLLHFKPHKENANAWEPAARKIAESALKFGLATVNADNRASLEDAINRIPLITPTPILCVNEQTKSFTNSPSCQTEGVFG